MRVITGTARGSKLKTLEGLETRPTTDRVKEAIFNIIQFDVEGRRILDLFGGSGQLAIEAISRGAESAIIVDQNKEAIKIIKDNLHKTRMDRKATVIMADSLKFLANCREKVDVIFLDPPYASTLLEQALQIISEIDILNDGGIIVCEHPREKQLPASFGNLICSKDYNYGKISVHLYSR